MTLPSVRGRARSAVPCAVWSETACSFLMLFARSADVRDLVSLQEVMEELGLGPNGGLLYCMEYLEENLDEWLAEALEVRHCAGPWARPLRVPARTLSSCDGPRRTSTTTT
eukprot:scaffold51_cov401-Prasinococcus_capsulatus_cf.AAC.48